VPARSFRESKAVDDDAAAQPNHLVGRSVARP
jgi:hypothetical protein